MIIIFDLFSYGVNLLNIVSCSSLNQFYYIEIGL